MPDLAEPGNSGPLVPAQHDDPTIGVAAGWAAADMPTDLYVDDDYTEDTGRFPLVADGTQVT